MSNSGTLLTLLPFGLTIIIAAGVALYTHFQNRQQRQTYQEIRRGCLVCFREHTSERVVLPCSHQFCSDCLTMILENQNTCPQCRAKIPSDFMRLINNRVNI